MRENLDACSTSASGLQQVDRPSEKIQINLIYKNALQIKVINEGTVLFQCYHTELTWYEYPEVSHLKYHRHHLNITKKENSSLITQVSLIGGYKQYRWHMHNFVMQSCFSIYQYCKLVVFHIKYMLSTPKHWLLKTHSINIIQWYINHIQLNTLNLGVTVSYYCTLVL